MSKRTDAAPQGAAVYSVREFGAQGNGQDKDTAAIQRAIDTCAGAGGGVVCCPPGRYLCGTLFLRSDVHLHLEAGSTMVGSPDRADYSKMFQSQSWVGQFNFDEHLICARGCRNIVISGHGTIDGNGRAFLGPIAPGQRTRSISDWRPGPMITFIKCQDVSLHDIRLIDSPSWTVWPQACERVHVHGVTIVNSREVPNSDGINPISCRDVRISDCHIDAGDDCIGVFSASYYTEDVTPCENVVVNNCVLSTPCNGIRVGFTSDYPIRNCIFSNIVMLDTGTGISMLCTRSNEWKIEQERISEHGPITENISFHNIEMDTLWPIYMGIHDEAKAPAGIRGVTISDVRCTADRACYIGGASHLPIEDVSIRNVRLRMRGQMNERANTAAPPPYPEPGWDVRLPYGFYCRNVRGLEFDHVRVEWEDVSGGWLSAIRAENVEDVALTGVTASQAPGRSAAAIHLTDVDGAFVQGCRAAPGTATFLAVDGARSAHVHAVANDLGRAAEAMQIPTSKAERENEMEVR